MPPGLWLTSSKLQDNGGEPEPASDMLFRSSTSSTQSGNQCCISSQANTTALTVGQPGLLPHDHDHGYNPEDYSGHMDLVQVELEAAPQGEIAGELQAFRNVISGSHEECSFLTQQDLRFTVTKPDRTHQPNSQRQCFWTRPSLLTEVVPLQISSQYRAAFELAQACLLFLDSNWFSQLCSCELRCGKLSQSGSFARVGHEFALQTGPPRTPHQHLEIVGAGSIDSPHTRLTKSIRRLGLLLIELHRLAVIRDIFYTEDGAMTSMVIMKAGVRDPLLAEEVLEDPKIPGPYKKALDYCLTAEFQEYILTSTETLELRLKEFYEKVVQPLKDLYDEARR